jgi:predicted RNA binding protein YcfA (HicA-like mRNA interferase family)
MKAREVIAILRRHGFVEDHHIGSHKTFLHEDGRRVTVPVHPGDIRPGTLRAIFRVAKIDLYSD